MKPTNFIRVPLIRQSTSYTCGIAALQSVLGYYGFFYREDRLSELLGAHPDHGTKNWEMVKFVKTLDLEAVSKTNLSIQDLESEVENGNLVIVAIQAWKGEETETDWEELWDHGHYVVVIGYDDENLYFMDPSTLGNYTFISKSEFSQRWHDIDQNNERVIHLGIIVSNPEAMKLNDPDMFKHIG